MTKITWDGSASIGVEIIDKQHRQIVRCINELSLACEIDDRRKVTEIIDTLQYHTVAHFAYEEELMEKAGYPMTETHKLNHEFFLAKIDQYANAHGAGLDIGRDLLRELEEWWLRHIQKEDILIAGYARRFLLSDETSNGLPDPGILQLH